MGRCWLGLQSCEDLTKDERSVSEEVPSHAWLVRLVLGGRLLFLPMYASPEAARVSLQQGMWFSPG